MQIPTTTVADVPTELPAGTTILDVREQDEWDHGHIAGAVHVPMSEISERLGDVPTGPTYVVCKVGGRSARVVAWLAQQGRDVVNVDGGMLEWEAAGRPMVSETGAPPQVV